MFYKIVACGREEFAIDLFKGLSSEQKEVLIPIMRTMLPVTNSLPAVPSAEAVQTPLPIMNWQGMQFNHIPAANRAIVGNSNKSDNPVHLVTLPAFYIMENPVTQASYREIMNLNPARFQGDIHPIDSVSWNDAVDFAKQLSSKANDIAHDVKMIIRDLNNIEYLKYAFSNPEAKLFRLPSETEWEFAARGHLNGSTDNFPWGDTINDIDKHAQTSKNRELTGTKPVGLLAPNGFGLKDMIGNVWEWTASGFKSNSFKAGKLYEHPTGIEDGNSRVLRGGSWYNYQARNLHPAYRDVNNADRKSNDVGFRLVRQNPLEQKDK